MNTRFLLILLMFTLLWSRPLVSQQEPVSNSAELTPHTQLRNAFAHRNDCDFGKTLADIETINKEHPDDREVADTLLYYYLMAGQFDKAREIRQSLFDMIRHDETLKERMVLWNILFKFYQDRDYKTVSQSYCGDSCGPLYYEAVILSSIITNNQDKMKLCQHRKRGNNYYCILATKKLGQFKANPKKLKYQAERKQLISQYCKGEISKPELTAALSDCLKDVPAYRKIMMQVLDSIP